MLFGCDEGSFIDDVINKSQVDFRLDGVFEIEKH